MKRLSAILASMSFLITPVLAASTAAPAFAKDTPGVCTKPTSQYSKDGTQWGSSSLCVEARDDDLIVEIYITDLKYKRASLVWLNNNKENMQLIGTLTVKRFGDTVFSSDVRGNSCSSLSGCLNRLYYGDSFPITTSGPLVVEFTGIVGGGFWGNNDPDSSIYLNLSHNLSVNSLH